ncbi:uncharacterized protein FTJAE_627 [Fusarium tjaetaba]|uniref:Uncharacterized protein n=1 Tax=Fusarium tjaetaba TaxID=1567544 RepID=A0A8H5SEJ3_9HYPO|nr:uncharacterized protein FTJAE_627 [Fusarium tjaetaba]KAF5650203.1 hypothetical protein FTJAE_627 [Fusarium tjaetaba]
MDDKKTPEELPGDTGSAFEQLSDGENFLLITLPQVQVANFVVEDIPSVFLARLKAMLRPDNRKPMGLLQHLQQDPVSELMSQRQTPREWLEKLTGVDFTDPASILDLGLELAGYKIVGEFALCTDGKDTFTVSPNPGAMSVDYTPVLEDSDAHPGLLSLEFVNGSDKQDKTAKSSGVNQPLPSLVMPIGQISKRYTTESGLPLSDETNYVLVVDAVASAHPVWLIFDRMLMSESDQDDEYYRDNKGGEEKEGIHPDTVDLLFNGSEKNFDAAQVLPSIQDWFQLYDKLSFTQIRDSFRKTGLTGKVKARVVTAEDASVLWNKDPSVDKSK